MPTPAPARSTTVRLEPPETGPTMRPTLPGRYAARLHEVDCSLELRLDHTGCLSGEFIADGEHLEIIGGVPNAYGEVFGLIREPAGETLAVFRAAPDANGLLFEVDLPKEGDLMHLGNAERLTFKRLDD